MKIEINNNNFTLNARGAIFWEEKKILLISDVHLGKIAHFRKHGIAIPSKAINENFKRLDEIAVLYNPSNIIFLGDLFHSKINNEWKFFCDWANKMKLEIILIEGNHDSISNDHYCDLNIAVYQELSIDGFLLTHHPTENPGLFNFCGHIHPGINLKDVGRQSVKLPCFFRRENQLILPAFGEFTGNFFIKPKDNDIVYAVANNEVIRVF
ncbi:ligase-associated DNA damage response endonuclease PdeM [Flavobacterium sp.]|uniref:ligase-associated DNA damage response endonuclease PdeM n=1 Tax=Flavobacterium sp. TaxID=239 RepID=UPI0025F6855F|nr:ligase-associated DNA damage response endonuclease PdeM [Flavobacterium sp.]